MIDDRTWTVTDGVEATEIAYVSYEGYTTKMFVVEVDLSNPAISIAASLPDNGTTFKMQSMTRQALAADAAGNKVWAGFNADFFNMTTGVPRGPVHRNGVMLKNTFDSGERSVFTSPGTKSRRGAPRRLSCGQCQRRDPGGRGRRRDAHDGG